MDPFLTGIRIIGGPVPIVVDVLAGFAAIWLAVRRFPRGRARMRWAVTVLLALLVGASFGLLACWVVGDLMNLFGVALSPTSRFWVAAGFAGMTLAVANLRASRVRRKVGAVAAILVFAVQGALGVNADFGQYTTLGSVAGVNSIAPLPAALLATQQVAAGSAPATDVALWKTWTAPGDLPAKGMVGSVTIPATVSHFAARTALVYLPPAALVANPPALPVLVMLSGQPGSPENVFLAGHVDTVLDGIAAADKGLSPIVVVPDQLSAPSVNPMCVDSALGNSATYLTVDVPAWIRTHLNVQSSPTAWGIGGFSQGGTCAIQLGAGHPELFGSILDVSGELEPSVGTPDVTIAKGFAGDAAAYEAARPLSLLAAHTPYTDTVGVFAAGELDPKYTQWTATIAGAAQAAGIRTTVLSSPGTAHDWYTVGYALDHGLPAIYAQMGLLQAAP